MDGWLTTRPEFDGIEIRSPVDGSADTYFPAGERTKRDVLSKSVILTCGVGVLSAVLTIFFLKVNTNDGRGNDDNRIHFIHRVTLFRARRVREGVTPSAIEPPTAPESRPRPRRATRAWWR